MQIYAMPVFDMMETVLVKKLHFSPCLTLRLITRSLYVGNDSFSFKQPYTFMFLTKKDILISIFALCHAAFTMFIGMTFPFFGGLLSFFGGFAFAPTTYFVSTLLSMNSSKFARKEQ